jgi:hypothetical protein
VSAPLRPGGALWTDRHEAGTKPSQTRQRLAGSVNREGGGTTHPTLGGGIGVTRARGTLEGAAP